MSLRDVVPDLLLNNFSTIIVDGEEVVLRRKHSSKIEDDNDENQQKDEENKKITSVQRLSRSLRSSFRDKNWKNKFVRSKSSGDTFNGSIKSYKRKTQLGRPSSLKLIASFLPIPAQPPPAPLLVEDPPSSENGSDLEDIKPHGDPALLNGSSGNFGSAGARSAPSTPQGVLGTSPGGLAEPLSTPCSPGYISPSIPRSPSHNIFTKYDKGALKQLSTSTPTMTAQAQSPEPPSPKATSKEDKAPTTSKARQKKFHRHFPAVDVEEKVLNYYSCALIGDILLQGHLYITKNYFAFYSNVFGYVTKLLIPMLSVEKITKEKTARIIPNAVGISTSEDKHVFGSLMSRDNTYRYMNKVLEAARTASQIPVEPEISEPLVPSDSDSSEIDRDVESEHESQTPEPNNRILCKNPVLNNEFDGKTANNKRNEMTMSFREGCTRLANLPRHSLLLFATTFLLVLLFLSAAVLLYRIGRVQHKFTLALQDNLVVSGSEDIYSDLLQWQTALHSKSAGAVHSFLDTNLDQIAKVRQSLEALSTLLMPNNKAKREPTTSKPLESPDGS